MTPLQDSARQGYQTAPHGGNVTAADVGREDSALHLSYDEGGTPVLLWEPQPPAPEAVPCAPVFYCVHFVARILENVLSHREHAKAFVDAGGLPRLLELVAMPTLPLLFAKLQAAHTMSAALRCISAQVDGDQVLQALLSAAGPLLTTGQHTAQALYALASPDSVELGSCVLPDAVKALACLGLP